MKRPFQGEKMFIPYIGICDFMSQQQVLDMKMYFKKLIQRFPTNRRLMVGTMMSRKTLRNEPTKWTTVFPKHDDYKNIFVSDPMLINTLHYADYEGLDLVLSLKRAIHLCGESLDAVQLDMVWPDPKLIQSIAKSYPHIDLILQVGDKALNLEDNKPERVSKRIKKYGQSISCVLLDRSGGIGLPLIASDLITYIDSLKNTQAHVPVAVAGGIGPYTLDLVEPVLRMYPDVSFDAQSMMRPSGSAQDPIDWTYAKKYVERALSLIYGIKNHPD